jgi:hypothetical protein
MNRPPFIVFIEGVREVLDPNPYPAGISQHSLIIKTPNRDMKITAGTKERHEIWFNVSLWAASS